LFKLSKKFLTSFEQGVLSKPGICRMRGKVLLQIANRQKANKRKTSQFGIQQVDNWRRRIQDAHGV